MNQDAPAPADSARDRSEPAPGPLSGAAAELRRALLGFFDREGRDLPWRRTSDPYRILVSEIMLQQTRVDAVVPYYRRWLARFPDLRTLADADEDAVLLQWQGLGYYRRARNLQRAAQTVVAEHGGVLPGDARALAGLPGVGPYTAGAVASIAFGEAVPAVDGNVRRVLSRLLDEPDPSPGRLREVAGAMVDPDRPGDFNQALMELGATVCTPRNPRCSGCPVRAWCAAREAETVEARPAPPRRREVPRLVEAVAVVLRGGGERGPSEVLLRRRPRSGLLGGLWECPGIEMGGEEGPDPGPEAVAEAAGRLARELLARMAGPAVRSALAPGLHLPAVDHAFTHRKVRYRPVVYRWSRELPHGDHGSTEVPEPVTPTPGSDASALSWAPLDRLERFPLPRAQERILDSARGAFPES
jgi:A/G-specific adenine glycosylase